jgi:hypothetical protein
LAMRRISPPASPSLTYDKTSAPASPSGFTGFSHFHRSAFHITFKEDSQSKSIAPS